MGPTAQGQILKNTAAFACLFMGILIEASLYDLVMLA
jgi:hypothetical protein